MRFIDDSRYLRGDKFTEIQRRLKPRENNMSFEQMSSPGGASKRKEYRIIAVKALRKMDVEEGLYIDYGSEYSFPSLLTQ